MLLLTQTMPSSSPFSTASRAAMPHKILSLQTRRCATVLHSTLIHSSRVLITPLQSRHIAVSSGFVPTKFPHTIYFPAPVTSATATQTATSINFLNLLTTYEIDS